MTFGRELLTLVTEGVVDRCTGLYEGKVCFVQPVRKKWPLHTMQCIGVGGDMVESLKGGDKLVLKC